MFEISSKLQIKNTLSNNKIFFPFQFIPPLFIELFLIAPKLIILSECCFVNHAKSRLDKIFFTGYNFICLVLRICGCRIVAIISAFQAEEGGSIPPTRSELQKQPYKWLFLIFYKIKRKIEIEKSKSNT